jgi:hypothetical protein
MEHLKFSFSRFVRELLRGSNPTRPVTTTVGETDLRFSPEEIEKFHLQGRVKRQDSNKILLKNPPFILREPQDERRSDRNHWRFFRSC